MDAQRFILMQRMTRACTEHRRDQMGSYAVGPFTRIGFFLQRGAIGMDRALRPDNAGTAIYTIGNRV